MNKLGIYILCLILLILPISIYYNNSFKDSYEKPNKKISYLIQQMDEDEEDEEFERQERSKRIRQDLEQ
jgi:hypothetical protein